MSSSAHLSLVPWFAGWRLDDIDPGSQKSFDVALHVAAAAALLLGLRGPLLAELRGLDRPRALAIGLSLAPAAVVGYGLERQIERRLGGPRTIAWGLMGGSLAMVVADRAPQRRTAAELRPRDGLALGLAQAASLLPGVSRSGATMAAARAMRFRRPDAYRLSWIAALPVILGAGALKAARGRREGIGRATGAAVTAGAAASFASTLACRRLLSLGDRGLAAWPFAAYRTGLAAAVAFKLRRGRA